MADTGNRSMGARRLGRRCWPVWVCGERLEPGWLGEMDSGMWLG